MNLQRISLLKEFIKNNPGDPFNQYALSLEYIHEMPHEALKILTDLQEKKPTYLPTYYTLGNLLYEIGMTNQSMKFVSKGMEVALSQGEEKTYKELKNLYQTILYEDE